MPEKSGLARLAALVGLDTAVAWLTQSGTHHYTVVPEDRERGKREQERVFILPDSEATYEVTKNPLYVWRAYLEKRRYDEQRNEEHRAEAVAEGLDPETWTSRTSEVADWILEYFDSCAERLLEQVGAERARRAPAAVVAEALGFKGPGRSGRGNSFSDFASGKRLQRLVLAARVYLVIVEEGQKPDFAAERVAREQAVHRSTAARAYREHLWLIEYLDRDAGSYLRRYTEERLCALVRDTFLPATRAGSP